MGSTLTTFLAITKERYSPWDMQNIAYFDTPGLGLIAKKNKKADIGGKYLVQPLKTYNPGGGSIDFSTAMAATNNNSTFAGFEVSRVRHYRLASVTTESIEAVDGDEDSFQPAIREFDAALETEGYYLNHRLYRGRGGYICRMTNTVFTTTVMTVDDSAGLWGVVPGDVLNLATTDGTSGSVESGSLTIASVQPQSGTVTANGNIVAGVATCATNDYVFLAGDFLGTAVGSSPAGFEDWCPATAPTDTFFNVDRSKSDLLGGARVDGTSGQPLSQVFTDIVAAGAAIGGKIDTIIVHPLTLATLQKQELGRRVELAGQGYDGEDVDLGYEAFELSFSGVTANVVTDRMCQRNRAWGLEIDKWAMFSAGMAPKFLQQTQGMLPVKVAESADAVEARVGQYMNYITTKPTGNCNAQLPNG